MGQLESFNPATGALVGTVETIEPKDVDGIVADIAEIQPFWAQLTPEDRGRYLRRVADELVDDLEGVARLISTEQGKPMAESYVMELDPDDRRPPLVRGRGPEDPARRADLLPPDLLQDQAELLQLRADRRRRRHRSVELPVVDPVRRGRDRADVRERRDPQAREPHPAPRRPDPGRVRARRRARGPRAHRPRRRPDRPGHLRVARASARSSSPARSRSGARSARSARAR